MNYKKDYTDTTLFMMPTLTVGSDRLEVNGFINAFLDDIDHMHYEDAIYMLFKPHDLDLFNYFLYQERERITIIEDYDYEEYVIIVYKLPEDFKEDFHLFMEGKYSKFSRKLKEIFKEGSIQYHIVTKSKEIRDDLEEKLGTELSEDSEVWRKPDMSKEVLDIQEIKSNATH